MAANRKSAAIKLQQEINIILSVLLVWIFGVLLCVLKIIVTPPFLDLLYHNFINISSVAVWICLQFCLCREKRVKYSATAECEIIHFVNCEISPFGRCEMKFAHIRVSEYFTFAEQIFHSAAISLARRANFVEKSSFERTSFFLAGVAGFEPTMRESKSLALPLGDTPVLSFVLDALLL